jgi:ADP-sugar diphosphatase
MSSFILPNSQPECTVELPKDLSKEQLLSFPPFKEWLSTLDRSLTSQTSKDHTFHEAPYKLRKIVVQTVDFFGSRIGFLKLQTEVSNDNGERLPGAVFMRGGSVGMLVRFAITISKFLLIEYCR